MSVDLSRKEIVDLVSFETNYRKAGQTNTDFYRAILRELEIRRKGLDLEKSRQHVIAAAGKRRFVSYKELADVNGLDWSKAHWAINDHLGRLCAFSYHREQVLLSAIVVNVANVTVGNMDPGTLKGFIDCARIFTDVPVGSEEAFLRAEQNRVFERYASEKHA